MRLRPRKTMIARQCSRLKQEDAMRVLFGALAVTAVLSGSACSQPYGYGDPGYGSGYGYAPPAPAYGYGAPGYGYAAPPYPYGDRGNGRREEWRREQGRREELRREEGNRVQAEQRQRDQHQAQDREHVLDELRARLPH